MQKFEYNEFWRCLFCGELNNFERKYCDECGAVNENEDEPEENSKEENKNKKTNLLKEKAGFLQKRIIPY